MELTSSESDVRSYSTSLFKLLRALVDEGTCARNKAEVHSSGATHCSTRCCATGTPLLVLLPSLSDHELLEPGGGVFTEKREVGREGSAKRKGAEGRWIYLHLPAEALDWSHRGRICSSVCPLLEILHNVCSCADLLLHFTSFSHHISHQEPNWEEHCCCCSEGLTSSPILSDCSFINSCHCCITVKNS